MTGIPACRRTGAPRAVVGMVVVIAALAAGRATAQVPAPEAVLGFRPGTDSMLASWAQITDYFGRLAAASPRVRLDTLGPTTQGRPYLLATISDPANLARRAALMATQARLADPRTLDSAAEARLVATQPAVVLISCSIHSTEIAASQMALELAHRLATDSALGAALRHVVVLLVPSANPDGVDIVGDWYRRMRGTPYDGTSPPWLYHPYVGHDNNRDWYMLTQVETRHLTRVLYRQWFPEVVYDIHQMGGAGARLFLPPFDDPVNPNLDGMVVEAINHVGTAMATALADAGRSGVAHQTQYDLWWHGGNRTAPVRHNMIGILSEAASVRIASPVQLRPDQIRQGARGVNFPLPWPGGWWRLRDIVEYELIASEALVRLAASERAEFVRRFVRAGRNAVEAGRTESPRAYLIPPGQRDEGARTQLANVLLATGIEVSRARAPFTAEGRAYPAGTFVIALDQPFRTHVKDLFERQAYPERREYPGGPLLRPYDVTGWTLPLTMGVAVDSVRSPVSGADLERLDTATLAPGRVSGGGDVVLLANRSNAEGTAAWRALAAGGTVTFATEPFEAGGSRWPSGTLVVRGARAVLARAAAELGFDAVAVARAPAMGEAPVVRRVPRVALYRSWNASMDEGWTRWVLERLGVPFTSVSDSVVRAGVLRQRFEVVILPGETPAQIRNGRAPGSAPPEYTGGLGAPGVQALRDFLADGGTVIALDEATLFAIGDLGTPATVVVGGRVPGARNASQFSAPGSIFEAFVDRSHPVASGMDSVAAIYFVSSPVLDAAPGARAIASYRREGSPLLSGFVLGAEMLAGRAALLEAPVGRGRAILFAFSPQHRGQTNGTFKLLTNAILYGAAQAARSVPGR